MSTFPPDLFAGQRFAVVGLGRAGLPAARALVAMGAEVVVWDDNEKAREAATGLTIQDLRGGGLEVDAIILSPGIHHRGVKAHPIAVRAAASGVPIWTDSELLFQAVCAAGSKARFVGITGTNGKSTTTALIAHVLETAGVPMAAGANLGTAALSLPLLTDDGVYVLEMSSYMLERLNTLVFDAAIMLNLSPDHLDRHGDMAGYALAKAAVFHRQRPEDLAVIGIDDEWPARALAGSGSQARRMTVSGFQAADVWGDGAILRDAAGPVMDLREALTLPGAHNAQNAAAAVSVCAFLGVARDAIVAGIRTYPGLPHRQQLVATIDGIAFINDSKATNADSTARALGCHERIIWIAGGESKEGGIESLTEYFPRIAQTLLIGQDAPILAATLSAHGAPHETVGTLEAAVPAALAAARAQGANVVLLSPACASWDQFTGFDQRGDRFAELARALTGATQTRAPSGDALKGGA